MQEFHALFQSMPLFKDIEVQEYPQLLRCLHATKATFKKDEFVLTEGAPCKGFGVLLKGRLQIIWEDYLGHRTIVATIEEGDLFAETFACAKIATMPVSVLATKNSEVLLLDFFQMVRPYSATCPFHAQIMANMLQVMATKTMAMNQKLNHLSKRTTREKILSYLTQQANLAGSLQFTISLNRQQLADYLCVDRSALSLELSRMQKDGLLQTDRSHFFLSAAGVQFES